MICSDTVEQREKALAKLEPMQQGDFEAMYEALEGRPMTVRFLDPPLTSSSPLRGRHRADGQDMARLWPISSHYRLASRVQPMMGHRGCRLSVTFPEIARMQTRAVIKAALAVQARTPSGPWCPNHDSPVGELKEFAYVKSISHRRGHELISRRSDMKLQGEAT